MMYKHKNLKQLLCCVLLLCLFCGSSLGFFSVKAATVPGYSGSLYKHFITSDSKVEAEVRIVNFNPYYEQFSSDYLGRTNEPKYHAIVDQDYFISFTIRNRSDQDLKTTHNYFGAITLNKSEISVPAASDYKYSFTVVDNGWKIKELSDNIATIYVGGGDGSTNSVQIVPQSELYDGPYCAVPANTTVTFYMIVTRSVTWSCHCQEVGVLLSPSVPLTRSDCPVNNVLYAIDENAWSATSSKVRYTPNTIAGIEDQLISINAQLNTIQNNQVIAQATEQAQVTQQTDINSNITDQTQQQQENYDAFSASTDSSDSSNINSAITSGTDAVKQKMGLFSFFDGIVSDLSDVLTKNHERHLVLPALDVPLPEETVHIWDRKEFDFEELENNFGAILTVVRFATVAVCYVTMINGAYHLFHKFIGVKDSDA